jgi:hypothetical protein
MGLGNQWKDVYAEVRSPGILCFFKDVSASKQIPERVTLAQLQADPNCQACVNLRTIINFLTPPKKEKGGKESFTLELELADESIKVRFRTLEERERWQKLLMEWKDFKTDFGMSGVCDVVTDFINSCVPAICY